MARHGSLDTEEKVRLLRALAFQVHRKRAADEVLAEHIDDQFAMGRKREYRPAADAMNADGFVAALQALEILGDEAAVLMRAIHESKDHRLMASALNGLADFLETRT